MLMDVKHPTCFFFQKTKWKKEVFEDVFESNTEYYKVVLLLNKFKKYDRTLHDWGFLQG